MYKKIIFLLAVSQLIGCGANVKSDIVCQGQSNEYWFNEGYETATEGKPIRTFDDYKDQCGDAISKEQRAEFINGYTKGALEFCTYENGYELGVAGKEFPKVCPFEIRANFLDGYKKGQIAHNDQIKRMEKHQRDADYNSERIDRIGVAEEQRRAGG